MALPLFQTVCVGEDSYLLEPQLLDLVKTSQRSWRFNGRIRSLQWEGGYMKALSGFADHANDEWAFMDLMEDVYSRGIKRPSSYASLFHGLVRSPSIQWTFNGPFVDHFAGGWEEAKFTGEHHQRLMCYDMNSAYLWSLTHGLPEPKTFRAEDFPSPVFSDEAGFQEPGLYLVELEGPCDQLPYPFNQPRKFYVASTEEIEAYSLEVKRYHFGVTWAPALRPTAYMTDAIQSLPCAKQTSRSYWGRWASAAKLECCTPDKSWKIRNPVLNIVWAHQILSRVKLKIWREVTYPKHVYVDSVITQEELATGDGLGEWRLVTQWDNGLDIKGTGMYGPIGGSLEKHIGHRRN